MPKKPITDPEVLKNQLLLVQQLYLFIHFGFHRNKDVVVQELCKLLPNEFEDFKSIMRSDYQSKHAHELFLSNKNPTEFNLDEFILTRNNQKKKTSIHLSPHNWHEKSLQVDLVDVEEIGIENYALGQDWAKIDRQEHFSISEEDDDVVEKKAQHKLLSCTIKHNEEELLIKENTRESILKQEGHLQKYLIFCNFKDLIAKDPAARSKYRSILLSQKIEALLPLFLSNLVFC